MDLQGKIAIVTGASSGIGAATALKLVAQGVKVAVVARRKNRLDDLAERIDGHSGVVLAIEADITDKVACQKLVEQVETEWGRVDILVNNAGVMLLGPAVDAQIEEWERMVNVNLMGLLYMTHSVLPIMRRQKSGHIVNISSVAGRTTNAGSAVYNATKWGVNAFTDALRQELVGEKSNVRTTIIEPGVVETELISHNRPEIQNMLKDRFEGITKRLDSDDIAASILFAVSQPEHVNINEMLIRPSEQVG